MFFAPSSRFLRLPATRVALLVGVLLLISLMTGCGGGGGGGGGGETTTVQPRLSVGWPARSRSTAAPASALSVVVRLSGARPDNSDLVLIGDRGGDTAAFTTTYTAPGSARLGTWPMHVEFHAQAGGSGAIVAAADTSATVDAAGLLPDVVAGSRVASVAIASGQSLLVGELRDLSVTALDAGGATLALTPGSFFWQVSSGAAARIEGGRPLGVAPGTVTLIARADGVSSAPVTVTITSDTQVAVNPPAPSIGLGATQTFTVSVTGSTVTSTAVTWSIDEGASGGQVSSAGMYTAPSTAGAYHVRATSVYDPSRSGVATVTVQAGGVNVGGEFPGSGGVNVGID